MEGRTLALAPGESNSDLDHTSFRSQAASSSSRRSIRDPDGHTDHILLLKTQLALKIELRRQLETELCGRDELIRALQTKLAQRDDFGADMEQIQYQLDQLERSCRALQERMQHNIVVEAGSRLRALYSCLANFQRGEGSWKDVEEELRQALKSCGVAVARLEKEKEGLAAAAI
jgi:CRISPR/Cas system CSM-associated protein Csm2 small subunit